MKKRRDVEQFREKLIQIFNLVPRIVRAHRVARREADFMIFPPGVSCRPRGHTKGDHNSFADAWSGRGGEEKKHPHLPKKARMLSELVFLIDRIKDPGS